ncbi:MAG: cysteine desulfurase family protein [Saccharofermentanales bacterium]
MIYLDNCSTTMPLDEVCSVMDQSMRHEWGNPSSLHHLGISAEKQIILCKKELAEILSCEPAEICFTSCGTESINMALKGFWDANPRAGKHMITSMGEHKATLDTCRYLEKKGIEVDYLPLNDSGEIDFGLLAEKIRPQTSLISLLHINNETGSMLDVPGLVQLRNRCFPNVRIHLDCVQSFGKNVSRIGRLGVDFASISAHKIHGPKGIGIFYHNKSAKVSPLIHGGGQQKNLRSGTESLALIKGMTVAAREACRSLDLNFWYVTALKEQLLCELSCMQVDYRCNSPKGSSPYILNISFPGVKAQTLLHTLDSFGIYVSTISACSSKKQIQSHVLLAMGLDPALIGSSIRISFNRFNTPDEIIETAKRIKESVDMLKYRK